MATQGAFLTSAEAEEGDVLLTEHVALSRLARSRTGSTIGRSTGVVRFQDYVATRSARPRQWLGQGVNETAWCAFTRVLAWGSQTELKEPCRALPRGDSEEVSKSPLGECSINNTRNGSESGMSSGPVMIICVCWGHAYLSGDTWVMGQVHPTVGPVDLDRSTLRSLGFPRLRHHRAQINRLSLFHK
jgi:hypothetical protein